MPTPGSLVFEAGENFPLTHDHSLQSQDKADIETGLQAFNPSTTAFDTRLNKSAEHLSSKSREPRNKPRFSNRSKNYSQHQTPENHRNSSSRIIEYHAHNLETGSQVVRSYQNEATTGGNSLQKEDLMEQREARLTRYETEKRHLFFYIKSNDLTSLKA